MPRKKSSGNLPSASSKSKTKESTPPPPRWSAQDDVWVGFLNARMDDADFTHFEQWAVANELYLQEQLEDVIASGAKLTVAYDHENESWVASLTGRLCLGLDGRASASARGGTYQESVSILLYKHYVMAEEDWGSFMAKSSSFLKRG